MFGDFFLVTVVLCRINHASTLTTGYGSPVYNKSRCDARFDLIKLETNCVNSFWLSRASWRLKFASNIFLKMGHPRRLFHLFSSFPTKNKHIFFQLEWALPALIWAAAIATATTTTTTTTRRGKSRPRRRHRSFTSWCRKTIRAHRSRPRCTPICWCSCVRWQATTQQLPASSWRLRRERNGSNVNHASSARSVKRGQLLEHF